MTPAPNHNRPLWLRLALISAAGLGGWGLVIVLTIFFVRL